MKCIMIIAKNKKRFFVEEKNYPKLLEFARVFDIKIKSSETAPKNIINLKKLSLAFCEGKL